MARTADIIIVGLGASGSAAAYHAACGGHDVLGFDAFTPPHQHGSSHGGSRIIRKAYFEGVFYVPLLQRAYALWQALGDATGADLLHETGVLMMGRPTSPLIAGARAAAEAHHLPHECLTAHDVCLRLPTFHLPDDHVALWEAEAGWLDPEVCIQTHLQQAQQHGAHLHYGTPIASWSATDTSVTVTTRQGEVYHGARLLLCAGGWINDLLPHHPLSLRIERQVNAWFAPQTEALRTSDLPAYLWAYASDQLLYGFPHRGPGLKAGLHYHGQRAPHPRTLNRTVKPAEVEAIARPVQRLFGGGLQPSGHTLTCFYTTTPDGHYIVDRHPAHGTVWAISACSGHGFKASNALAERVVEHATAAAAEPLPDAFQWR